MQINKIDNSGRMLTHHKYSRNDEEPTKKQMEMTQKSDNFRVWISNNYQNEEKRTKN